MFVVVFLVSCSLQFACAGGQINKSSQPPLVIVSLDGMDWRILKNHRFTPNLVRDGPLENLWGGGGRANYKKKIRAREN